MPQRRAERLHNRTWAPRSYGGKLPPHVTKSAEVTTETRVPVDPRLAIATRGMTFTDWRERSRDYAIAALADQMEQRQERVFFDHFAGKVLDTTILWLSTSSGGSATVIDGKYGGWVRLRATAGGPGQIIRLDTNNIRQFAKSKNFIFRCRVQAAQAANFIFRAGLFNASLTQDYIWFEHSETAGGTAKWFGESDSGGTVTSTDTGVLLDTTTAQILEIRATTDGLAFSIDDKTKVYIESNIPTLDLQPVFQVTTVGAGGSGDKDVYVDYVEIWQDLTTAV